MSTKRVLFIIDAWNPIIGGGQNYLLNIVPILASKYNWSITILTRNIVGAKKTKEFEAIKEFATVKILGNKTELSSVLGKLSFVLQSIQYLRKHKKDFDVINTQSLLSGLITRFATPFKRRKIVHTIHGSRIHEKFIGIIERIIFSIIHPSLFISVSDNLKPYFQKNKLIVVHNGINIDKENTLTKSKQSSKNFVFLYVGRFDPVKGVDLLILAAKDLKKASEKFKIRLVGYGYDEVKLKELVAENNLSDTIIFVGKKTGNDLQKEYLDANCFVLPSRSEGFALTPLEAWRSKTPVLCSAVGQSPYIVTEKNGFLCKPNNVKDLAKTMKKAMQDKQLSKKGLEGYNTLVKDYTIDASAKKLNTVLEEFVNGNQ